MPAGKKTHRSASEGSPARSVAEGSRYARAHPYRGDHQRGEIELIEPRAVFSNRFVAVYNDRVRFANGEDGEYFRWHWQAPYGVVSLPVLADGSVFLVEQFRHMGRQWRLEAPRGFGTEEETPAQAAAREVGEETSLPVLGVRPWRQTGDAQYPNHLLFVDVGEPAEQALGAALDPTESIAGLHRFSAMQIPALLADERICDSETLLLLLAHCRLGHLSFPCGP